MIMYLAVNLDLMDDYHWLCLYKSLLLMCSNYSCASKLLFVCAHHCVMLMEVSNQPVFGCVFVLWLPLDKHETFQAARDDCVSTLQRLPWSSREVSGKVPSSWNCNSSAAREEYCRYASLNCKCHDKRQC